ncbi:MAG: hypothetical protein V4622_10980 [Bacteroidota bacterium]
MKIWILLLCFSQFTFLPAQTSPIQWTNNSFNINVDIYSNKKNLWDKNLWGYDNGDNSIGDLKYTFKNICEHLISIDTNIFYQKLIANVKPNETLTISLSSGLFNFDTAIRKRKDTIAYLYLPFYYEGKIYREKVACKLTFGKSKLIEHDNLNIDVTKKVNQIFKTDTIHEYPSVMFTHYFTIKNISNKSIFCTKNLVAYNDSQALKNYNNYVEISPGETYEIPAKMNMDRKYRFKSVGKIEVFSEDVREEYHCDIISNFQPKIN